MLSTVKHVTRLQCPTSDISCFLVEFNNANLRTRNVCLDLSALVLYSIILGQGTSIRILLGKQFSLLTRLVL